MHHLCQYMSLQMYIFIIFSLLVSQLVVDHAKHCQSPILKHTQGWTAMKVLPQVQRWPGCYFCWSLVLHVLLFAIPETNSLHLKIDVWNTSFLWGSPTFRFYVSFREGIGWLNESQSISLRLPEEQREILKVFLVHSITIRYSFPAFTCSV